MLIGDIAKDSVITIYYNTPFGTYEYRTTAIECGDTNFELVVHTILDENNKIVKFNPACPTKIELQGASQLSMKVDSINFSYKGGKTCHVITSHSRISVVNKRDTFRLPFKVSCTVDMVANTRVKGMINDISFEGLSVTLPAEETERIIQGSVLKINFVHGLAGTHFEFKCKVVRIHDIDEHNRLFGCAIEQGSNSMRNIIMQIQMEEARKKRSTYVLKK